MDIPIRATIIFFFLWALTRALGRRELAEMTAFELLLLVAAGDFVQQGVTQDDRSVTGAMLAVGTLGVWTLVWAYVSFRLPRARAITEGVPVLVVRDGKMLTDVMRVERLSVDELEEAARSQGIADLAEIRVGVIEPDGKFSFIKQEGEQHQPEERPEP
jgi:uncharacterized membrane protein YcaP (DUF421 family)